MAAEAPPHETHPPARRPLPVYLPNLPISRLRVLHLGGYWRGVNDIVRQMMLGLRETGATVTEYCTDDHPEALATPSEPYDRGASGPVWLHWEAVLPAVESADPHLIVCNAGGLAFRPEVSAELRRTRCLVGIALSDPDVHAPTTRWIAPLFDLFLTNDPGLVPAYRAAGAVCDPLPIGTHPDFFRPAPPRRELECDALVLGRAHPDRVAPVRELAARFDLHLYGEGWEEHGLPARGLVEGERLLAALASARTTVVFGRTASGAVIVKVGLFDFLAAGALVLTDRSPATDPYFAPEREIVTFSSTAELVEKVRFLLDHPDAADRIRTAGRERVLRDHTWARIWTRLLLRLGATA